MATAKLYPFSTAKHAHDIEYRYNRTHIEMREYEDGESDISFEEYTKLRKLSDNLADLLEAVLNSRDGRVCYLTGAQIGLAKECVAWAGTMRCR